MKHDGCLRADPVLADALLTRGRHQIVLDGIERACSGDITTRLDPITTCTERDIPVVAQFARHLTEQRSFLQIDIADQLADHQLVTNPAHVRSAEHTSELQSLMSNSYA